jgi:hypothetical protein
LEDLQNLGQTACEERQKRADHRHHLIASTSMEIMVPSAPSKITMVVPPTVITSFSSRLSRAWIAS